MRPFIFHRGERRGGEALRKMRELWWGYLCASALKIDKTREILRKRTGSDQAIILRTNVMMHENIQNKDSSEEKKIKKKEEMI